MLLPRKIDLRPGLCLLQSWLGWIVGGRYHTDNDTLRQPALIVSTKGIPPKRVISTTHMLTSINDPLFTKPNLEQFWDLEPLGIRESHTTSDDDQALSHFNKIVVLADGQYFIT